MRPSAKRVFASHVAVLGCAVLLAGCARRCPLAGQQRAAETRLFFGRDIPGGGFVTDAAWSDFARLVVTPAFPDGFTIYDAAGQWQNPRDGRIVREKTFVLEIVGPVSPALLGAVMDSYRTRFRQESVGIVTSEVCARF